MFGAIMRGEVFDKRKAILFGLIIAGFISGGTSGAYLFTQLQFQALLVPAVICLMLAVLYRLVNSLKKS